MLKLLLLFPVLTAALCLLPLRSRWVERINILGSLVTGGTALYCSLSVFWKQELGALGSFLFIDELSAVLVFIIGVVGTICCLYTVSYLRAEQKDRTQADPRNGRFLGLLHLFVAICFVGPGR